MRPTEDRELNHYDVECEKTMKKLKILALILAFVVSATASANAALSLSLDDSLTAGPPDVVLGPTLMPSIGYFGPAGGWTVNIVGGVGTTALGAGTIDLSFNDVYSGVVPSDLTILFTETDVTPAFPGWALMIGGTINATPGVTVTVSAFADDGNTAFGMSTPLGTLGPFSGNGHFGGDVSTLAAPSVSAPYSLTLKIVISATQPFSQASGDAHLQPVPEPVSIAAWGILAVVGAAVSRRQRRS